MLCIVFTDAMVSSHHVGSPLPKDIVAREVEMVQADGHELEKIEKLFTTDHIAGQITIPMPRCRVVCWHGDIAKTIVSAIQGWKEW